MPWKECPVTDERLQFVARRLAGEPMADLCREFGISRKTGYKVFDRYQACALEGLTDIGYPFHDKTVVVTRCGRICLGQKKIHFSTVFAGQAVGIKEVHDDIWLVSFMDYDLGYFDLETRVLEPLDNPFGPKVSPM